VASSVDDQPSRTGPEPWCEDVAVVAGRLGTDVASGLTDAQAAQRLERVGPNQLEAAEPVPAWRRLAEQFRDPLVYLLLVAVAVSLVAWLLEGGEDVDRRAPQAGAPAPPPGSTGKP
jgi:Ca2+-transporting ATPase